ncbi:MAG: CHASE2 domain-containing protein [Spirochaetales bacterium]|nr:CHASE2 domain-containing protein [Spirochaetales bacterium]
MKKIYIFLLIPLAIVAVLSILNLTEFMDTAEKRIFDTLLHIKAAPPQHEQICIIGIDDPAIETAGPWPWPRDIPADGLIIMKELGALYVMFDVEYINESLLAVNPKNLDLLKTTIAAEFNNINKALDYLFTLLRQQKISFNEFLTLAAQETGISQTEILKMLNAATRNNDEYLGKAARLFGNAFFTVNPLPEIDQEVSEEERQFVLNHIMLKNAQEYGSYPHTAVDIMPTIPPILKYAKGAGFTKVIVDKDGVQRSINLLEKYKGKFLPQVALAPLLDWLGNPPVEVYSDHITLKGAEIPASGKILTEDINIPLNEEAHFIINWPHTLFTDSYKLLSYQAFLDNAAFERDLRNALKIMEANGYLSYYRGDIYPLQGLRMADELVADILNGKENPHLMQDYTTFREQIFKEIGDFLTTADKDLIAEIDAALKQETDPVMIEEMSAYREGVAADFEVTLGIYNNLMKNRILISQSIGASFCLIGNTSTATTDIGVTPFDENYLNVGTHASVVNTILTRSFLDNTPWWYSAILALILSAGAAYLLYVLKRPLMSIIIGGSIVVLIVVLISMVFIFTSVYFNLLTPTLAVFLTFLILTILNFLETAREKTFIRDAFSKYLSADVVNELILDPSKLNLGGEEKQLTAIFTDIKGFSSISEQLTPSHLVQLLNSYLTEMSNIIMELHGTIDKYEGDAIMCFFGAPIPLEDHAHRACLSAVRMKKMEKILNEHLLKENLSPGPLLTRIGINTGPMVVGNMGTAENMDYTIMGNSVNLASRLEGVNKIYGTWIIMSENTYQECGKDFVTRKLDRVRVVNIKQPVRLYELIDEKDGKDAKLKEALEIYNTALELFEQRDWDKANKQFKEVVKLLPDDGPSDFFIKRCAQYKRKAPEKGWDGVFNLATK